MYWFKTRFYPVLYVCLIWGTVILAGCKPEVKEAKNSLQYFDVKGFFRADSARLNKTEAFITKTIAHNGVTQTKKVKIANWGRELELFANSDINKPAWRESYAVTIDKGVSIYEAKSPDLKTRKITIAKDGDKVKYIRIYNHTQNLLYENVENLTYYPDSLYQIDKVQQVRLLGKNTYQVKGLFNN